MENFMEKQTEYEQEIDLVSLFFAVLHKYRQIFAAAVACAVWRSWHVQTCAQPEGGRSCI